MGNILRTAAMFVALAAVPMSASTSARADMVGAVAGAGTGLIVAGPPGAVVGGVVGAVFGKPFWGPSRGRYSCWLDNSFHRHCRRKW